MTIRVVVADDQALVRSGFTMLLSGEADIEVVGEAGNGARGRAAARRELPGRGADGRADAGDGRAGGDAADHR